jgi:hypothetical protein
VEIALVAFGGLSSRAIAEMCGVGVHLVSDNRQVCESHTSTVTGTDGKQYPAARKPLPVQGEDDDEDDGETEHEQEEVHRRPIGPPSDGMQFARIAIMNLEQIKTNDTERVEALRVVKDWITKHEN